MRRFILIYFLKQSVIFHIFTFCEIWRFPLSLLQRWFGPTLVLKPGTVLISDVLTFVSLRVWNWIRIVIWTHRCWVLIFPDASFILFYFILFPLFFLHLFVCCQHFESFLPPAASCDSEGFGQFVIFILYFKNKFNNKHSETFHVFKIWHQNILNIYNLFLLLNLWEFFLLMKRFLRHSELFFCSVWFWKFLLKWSFSSGLWNWIRHIVHWNFDLDSFLFWSLKATFSRWKSTNI